MFVLCPHCEFLVTVDPRSGQPPATCPKCGKALDVPTAPADVAVVDIAGEVVIEPAPPVAIDETPPQADAPSAPSADDFIAAMSAKPTRGTRAKSQSTSKSTPKKESTRRARAASAKPEPVAAPAPAEAAPVTPPAPETPPKPTSPSIAQRVSAWIKSLRPAPKPRAVKSEAREAASDAPARRKATVRPIPSLRERAAKRAAEADAARIATLAAEAEAISEIEALAISDMAPELPAVPEPAPIAEPPIAPAPAPISIREIPEPAPISIAEIAAAPPIAIPAPPPIPAPDIRAPTPAPVEETPAPAPPTPRPAARTRTTTAPSFARVRTSPGSAWPAQWPHIAVFAALSLLLALQLVLAQRDALAANARWRPTIDALCGVLRCSVPAWRQPDAFTMLSRDVRPHPRAPGTLQIDASFRNDARWAQPWPRLVVSLSDIDGRVVGTRAFTAREYLGAPPTQNLLASGQTAAIRLAVVEPAPGIVAFSFEFR
jgi:hypothetical protein